MRSIPFFGTLAWLIWLIFLSHTYAQPWKATADGPAKFCAPGTFLYLAVNDWESLVAASSKTPLSEIFEDGHLEGPLETLLLSISDTSNPGPIPKNGWVEVVPPTKPSAKELETRQKRFRALTDKLKGPLTITMDDSLFNMMADPELAQATRAKRGQNGHNGHNGQNIKSLAFMAHVGNEDRAVHKLICDIFRETTKGRPRYHIGRKIVDDQAYFHREDRRRRPIRAFTYWTFHEGVFILAPSLEEVKDRLQRLKHAPPSLADEAAFQPLANSDADVLFFLNYKPLARVLDKMLADIPLAGLFKDADLSQALDLLAFNTYHAAFKITPKGISWKTEMSCDRPSTLQGLLMPYEDTPARFPNFIANEFNSVATHRVSPQKFHDHAGKLFRDLAPDLHEMAVEILDERMQKNGDEAFDYRKDLMTHLGDSLLLAIETRGEKVPVSELKLIKNGLVAVELKNPEAFENQLNRLIAEGAEAPFRKESFLGHTIHWLQDLENHEEPGAAPDRPAPVPGFKVLEQKADLSYAILDAHLLIAIGPDAIKNAIKSHRDPARSFWKSGRDLIPRQPVPSNMVAYSSGNMDKTLLLFLNALDMEGLASTLESRISFTDLFGRRATLTFKDGLHITKKSIMLWATEVGL